MNAEKGKFGRKWNVAMLGGLMLKLPEFFGMLFRMMFCFAFIGAMSFLIGEALPRRNFNFQEFPFLPFAWEDGGRFYNRFRIDRWKDKLPDMSQYIQKAFRKKMPMHQMSSEHTYRLVIETCVAEVVHWVLVCIGPVYLALFRGAWGGVGLFFSVVGNLPFIMVQRYNRPRLVRMLDRQQKAEQKQRAK